MRESDNRSGVDCGACINIVLWLFMSDPIHSGFGSVSVLCSPLSQTLNGCNNKFDQIVKCISMLLMLSFMRCFFSYFYSLHEFCIVFGLVVCFVRDFNIIAYTGDLR